MTFLWSKRNEIVHHCPVVVDAETIEHLPDDLLTTAVLTQPVLERLTALATRVHLHSIGMFLKFVASYLTEMIEQLVDAWYYEQEPESS